MGLNSWWFKLFFYFLDVGSANALVLYRLSMNDEYINISNFKLSLVSSLAGNQIKFVPSSPKEVSHQLVRICMKNTVRHLCAYCALFYKKKRTRYKCKAPGCNMPLCSVGDHSGPGNGQDCFALAHHRSEMLRAVQQKYLTMSAKTNKNKCK